MTTPLGKLQATQKPAKPEPEASSLGKFLALGNRGTTATLPLLGEVWIELAGHDALNAAESGMLAEMKALGLDLMTVTAGAWETEKVRRVLASCVRDPKDHAKPFGTIEEWGKVDSDLLAACNHVYMDARAQLDPIGLAGGAQGWGRIPEEIRLSIKAAIEKKSPILLLSFGVSTLANYLLTLEPPPEPSPIPPLSSGES